MSAIDLLPALGGLAAGVLLALLISRFYLRARRRDAAALLADAESKALATLQTAAQEREQAKAAAILEGKMEVLRHREEAERELTRRREEADRSERRAEE
ncbi:MAG TPA: Rnase Y domain-containing protein, partial [Gemmatimonadales bacterium]|nr:Rnase Y domain-containing protein [Gemmatimonadales bacterium]